MHGIDIGPDVDAFSISRDGKRIAIGRWVNGRRSVSVFETYF